VNGSKMAPSHLDPACVPNGTSLRVFVALAAAEGHMLSQADIRQAYLLAPLSEKVVVMLPREMKESKVLGIPRDAVAGELQRAVYGLKESAAAFYAHVDSALKQIGFRQNDAAPSTYYMEHEKHGMIRILCSTDDLLVSSKTTEAYDWVIDGLEGLGMMLKKMGKAGMYLGVNIQSADKEGMKEYTLDMAHYFEGLYDKYVRPYEKWTGREIKVCGAPLPTNTQVYDEPLLEPALQETKKAKELQKVFRSIMGSLTYAATAGAP